MACWNLFSPFPLLNLSFPFKIFFEPLCSPFFYYGIFFQIIGHYFGYIFLISLAYLFIRRLIIDRNLYISILSDYFILILLFFIALSGVILKYFIREDVVSVKTFVLSLLSFRVCEIPKNPIFLIHFSLILLLFIYFSFSKLVHSIGIFFSPTRMQPDNPREKRFVNIWQ